MYPLFDPGVNGVQGSIEEIVPLAVRYGIGGLAVPVELLEDRAAGQKAAGLLRENGLRWGMLPTPADFFSEELSEEAFSAALETFNRWAEAGEQMGVRFCYNHVWSGSNFREHEAQFEWVLNRLRRVWKIADDHGIRYGMEFLGPATLQKSFRYPFFNSLSGVLALADAVHPRCGFVFDTYHWYCGSGQRIDEAYLAAAHVHRMAAFHVNDGVPGRSREEQEDMERRLPLTTGVIDAALPCRLFEQAGYDGPVLCEPMHPWLGNPEGRSLEKTVKTVAQSYRRLFEAAN